jgi:hypothetical protein
MTAAPRAAMSLVMCASDMETRNVLTVKGHTEEIAVTAQFTEKLGNGLRSGRRMAAQLYGRLHRGPREWLQMPKKPS